MMEVSKMRRVRMLAYGLTILVGVWAVGATIAPAQVKSQDPRVALVDNCDPISFPPGFCVPVPRSGDTTFSEFLALLFSPLINTVVGHPAWQFSPSYLDMRAGQTLRVTNTGGEDHTFTEVTAFGGGSIDLLNGAVSPPAPPGTVPLTRALQCPLDPNALALVRPGNTVTLKLDPGLHNFQCCIHPWMRAVIDVED